MTPEARDDEIAELYQELAEARDAVRQIEADLRALGVGPVE